MRGRRKQHGSKDYAVKRAFFLLLLALTRRIHVICRYGLALPQKIPRRTPKGVPKLADRAAGSWLGYAHQIFELSRRQFRL